MQRVRSLAHHVSAMPEEDGEHSSGAEEELCAQAQTHFSPCFRLASHHPTPFHSPPTYTHTHTHVSSLLPLSVSHSCLFMRATFPPTRQWPHCTATWLSSSASAPPLQTARLCHRSVQCSCCCHLLCGSLPSSPLDLTGIFFFFFWVGSFCNKPPGQCSSPLSLRSPLAASCCVGSIALPLCCLCLQRVLSQLLPLLLDAELVHQLAHIARDLAADKDKVPQSTRASCLLFCTLCVVVRRG